MARNINCVAGIDPSLTGFAVCVMTSDGLFDTKRWCTHYLGHRVDSRMDRMLPLVEEVIDYLDQWTPQIICIEGYAFGSNARGTMERIELGGILRADLHVSTSAVIHEVAPMTLKKFCTGSGKGDKTAMIAQITKKWRVEFEDSDRYDAYGLARLAMCLAGLSRPGTTAQRQAVDTVLRGPNPKKRRGAGNDRSH